MICALDILYKLWLHTNINNVINIAGMKNAILTLAMF